MLSEKKRSGNMPLSMARTGEKNLIKRVGGNDDIRHFLASLGFIAGSDVTLVAKNCGNIIVNVKESRIAISQEMANKILV
jgi:ferrous iron transport protein A